MRWKDEVDSRFAKIPQQTKYAHGAHELISCVGIEVVVPAALIGQAGAPRRWRVRVNVHVFSALGLRGEV
jgi:hypothetical protein